jgi:hypothetical protein
VKIFVLQDQTFFKILLVLRHGQPVVTHLLAIQKVLGLISSVNEISHVLSGVLVLTQHLNGEVLCLFSCIV